MNKEKREKKMSQRRPRKRSYPRRDFTPAEQQMFEKIIGNLKPYTEQKARTECVDKKGTKGWPWQSIMSCYGQQGLGIGPGSRYASEILPYEESYLRRKGLKGIPNYVAANLTAGANLGKKIREQKPQTAAAEIAKILGGYPVPWNQIAEGQGIGPGQFDYLFNPESKERERKEKKSLSIQTEKPTITISEKEAQSPLGSPAFLGTQQFEKLMGGGPSRSPSPTPSVKSETESVEETKSKELSKLQQKILQYQNLINQAKERKKREQLIREYAAVVQRRLKAGNITPEEVSTLSPDIYKAMGFQPSKKARQRRGKKTKQRTLEK